MTEKPKKRLLEIGRFVIRNRVLRKIGLDTDNCFSWMESEKETWNYKPNIVKKGNLLHVNYIVFSELINLLHRKYPERGIDYKRVLHFLRKNKITPIKKNDVNPERVNEILNNLKKEKTANKWSAGENDLKVISVYSAAGIDCISTNNLKDFTKPCAYLGISVDFPPIFEPGSRQDVNRILRDLYKNRPFKKNKRN